MKKKDKYDFTDKYDTSVRKANYEGTISKNIFTRIKEWIIAFVNFLIYQWKHNRMMFLLVLSLLFILGYYIYTNYVKENEIELKFENSQKHNNEFLQDFVKNRLSVSSSKNGKTKKSIPKKHEIRCRIIMEQLFKAPFVSIRPDFLKYKTGKNLELDVFNSDLMIALEYDGIHHRKFTEFFHKSEQDFIEQQERDRFKEEKCKELGITLIRVPDTVKFDDLEEYIKNELDKREIFYFTDPMHEYS